MKDFLKKEFLELPLQVLVFGMQLFLSAMALGLFLWSLSTYAKYQIFQRINLELYAWTYIFYRPVKGDLFNYLFVCLIFGLGGLVLYLGKRRIRLERWQEIAQKTSLPLLLFFLVLSIGILASLIKTEMIEWHMVKTFFVSCVPLPLFFWNRLNFNGKRADRFSLFFSVILIFLICLEPLRIVSRPVFLMNDYPDIFGETYLKGGKVSNKTFLQNLSQMDVDSLRLIHEVKTKVEELRKPESTDGMDDMRFIRNLTNRDLENALPYMELAVKDWDLWGLKLKREGYVSTQDYLNHLKNIDLEAIKKFYQANLLESLHQNMGRGQINHIGHILNPINEYQLGKPKGDIYFQYGLGYTFILKWMMEWFGGISIENQYKTYILYVPYFLGYFVMLLYIFRERFYVFAALAILPVCFYFLGYVLFILAPGFVPSIHFLDIPTIIFLVIFYRRQRVIYAGIAGTLALFSLLVNQIFGIALGASFMISLLLYVLENRGSGKRYAWILPWLFLFVGTILIFWVSNVSSGRRIFAYYLFGYFSWPTHPLAIVGGIFYLLTSYIFILGLKEKRFDLKYLYVFLFVYVQIILVYYFWIGLPNHLPQVFPFVWLQVLLTLYIIQKFLAGEGTRLQRMARQLTQIAVIGAMILILPTGIIFYKEKGWFQRNFMDHPVYQWTFDRARVISTVDPRLIQDSISLMQKYSPLGHAGIFIISKYDSLLPFLAHRYSAMPIFEMGYFLFSRHERDEAIQRVREKNPEYLFVDTNIQGPLGDLWEKIYRSEFFRKERASRLGRYEVLRGIFREVESDYERIETGKLISVYRRKGS